MKSISKKLICLAAAGMCAAYLLVANKAVGISEIEVTGERIPDSFDGFKIVQVSDLHNESFGKNNEKLLEKIRALSPDVIAVTGDIVDSYSTDVAVVEAFVAEAIKIAPVYCVTGNHEFRTDTAERLTASLGALGARVLRGERLVLERGGEAVSFYGIDDPLVSGDYLTEYEAQIVGRELEELERDGNYSILLSHRPEFFDIYKQYGFDLVLTGHAHGGQFRLPLVGGVIAPGQGFFPEYDSGVYEKDATVMVVSRGLGNSVIPLRINNNPELVLIRFASEEARQ